MTGRPLVSRESVQAAKAYDAAHKPATEGWQAATDAQAERIIACWLLWLADTLRENAP
jgi:hypothetical protein